MFNRIFYLHYVLSVVLFAVYSNMLIMDLSGVNQSWHYYQSLFLIFSFYSGVWLVENKLSYMVKALGLILMFPMLFNVSLNVFRSLPITYTNIYDFSFIINLILFSVGIFGIFIIEIIEGLNRIKKINEIIEGLNRIEKR